MRFHINYFKLFLIQLVLLYWLFNRHNALRTRKYPFRWHPKQLHVDVIFHLICLLNLYEELFRKSNQEHGEHRYVVFKFQNNK
jgi:hypothetical protein